MKITWYGDTCFEIASASQDKENISVQIDLKESEKKSGKFGADILLKNNSEEIKPKTDEQFVISAFGEYEIKGIFIQGISSLTLDKKQNIIYVVEAEGIRVCHLGLFGEDDLTEEQLESMGKVDILIVPINGDTTIGYREAEKMIAKIEPKMVIPTAYNSKKPEALNAFLKAMGEKDVVPQDKLSIQKKNLGARDEEKADIIILEEK